MQSPWRPTPEDKAELFTRAGEVVDRERFVASSQADPRVWTIIVSPEHGNQLDMQVFGGDVHTPGRTRYWTNV